MHYVRMVRLEFALVLPESYCKCTHVHMLIHRYTYSHTYIHTCKNAHSYPHIQIYGHTHLHIIKPTHAYAHANICCTCVHILMHRNTQIYMYIYENILHTQAHTNI